MKKINISIEHCLRYFENEIKRDSFLTFQVPFPHNVREREAKFSLFSENNSLIFTQSFIIKNNHIQFFGSHEDPIVSDKDNIFLSLHIPIDRLPKTFTSLKLQVNGLENFDLEQMFSDINFNTCNNLFSSISSDGFSIKSEKDCTLTFHLGDNQANYKEESFTLNRNKEFNFKDYVQRFQYIGIQCSYEDIFPEIEEKHIIKGQKGIYETSILYKEDTIIAQGLLPFDNKYLNQIQTTEKQFIKVNNIKELIEYHKEHPICFFESSIEFLEPSYRANNTYSQSKVYAEKKTKKQTHLDLSLCKECKFSCECIQVVPSGLSHELLLKTLPKSNYNDCEIHELINKKKA